MDGRCQCGQIRFTTPLPQPTKIFICHCTECRHQSSSAYGITASFPDFAISTPHPGAIAIFTRPSSRGWTECAFCTKCGARLTHRQLTPEGKRRTNTVSVKGGCLEALSADMLERAVHIWTSEAVVPIPPGVERYEEEPPRPPPPPTTDRQAD